MSEKYFNKFFIIFILLSVLIFFEGFFYYFSYKFSYYFDIFDRKRSGFNPLIWNENGIIEILQVILIFFSIINFIYILKELRKIKLKFFIKFILYIYIIGLLYFFFEEISWGQHIFGWESLDFFKSYNNQNETNIHNISNLFNELPRSILTLWCSISFIIVNIFSKKIKNYFLIKFLLPSNKLKLISLYLLFILIPDFFVDKMNLHPGHSEYSKFVLISDILDFVTFNFIKLSEYQELIFCYYILYHSIFFRKFLCLNENEKQSKT